MRRRLIAALVPLATFACGDSSTPTPAVKSTEPVKAPPADAGPSLDPAAAAAASTADSDAPEPSFHLDPDPEPSRPSSAPVHRRARPIELILRSTPPGATASVDGRPIGKTPTYWAGTTDGRPRDVTFALPGYAVARYRFVVTRSGVVHGSLRRLAKPEPDGSPAGPGEVTKP